MVSTNQSCTTVLDGRMEILRFVLSCQPIDFICSVYIVTRSDLLISVPTEPAQQRSFNFVAISTSLQKRLDSNT